jgi:hypothetical protein
LNQYYADYSGNIERQHKTAGVLGRCQANQETPLSLHGAGGAFSSGNLTRSNKTMQQPTFRPKNRGFKPVYRNAIFFLLISGFFLHANIASSQALAEVRSSEKAQDDPEIEKMLRHFDRQIFFTENHGQWEKDILYKADFPLGKAMVTRNGVVMRTFDAHDLELQSEQGHRAEEAHKAGKDLNEQAVNVRSHAWLMQFVNQLPGMRIEARMKHQENFNFFVGDVSATNVASYKEIWYRDVYKSVDVRYYPSEDGNLEYDIIGKKGFNPSDIVIRLDGVMGLKKGKNGELVISTSVGDMSLPAPYAYQQKNGKRQEVSSAYVIEGKDVIRFELGNFDKNLPLIIDPIALRWATWVNSNSSAQGTGTAGHNHGHGIWVDPSDGAIYIVARVDGKTDLITPGALETSAKGGIDLIVGKYFEPSTIGGAGQRVWQTYIGGGSDDNPYAMEQGPDGNLYITGYTASSDFPLIGGTAFGNTGGINHRSQSSDNTFILKINKDGNAIKGAVIGGDGDDGSYDLRVTPQGDVLICGNTSSRNLATQYSGSGAVNRSSGYTGGTDVHLFKINQNLSSILWMRNYGGTGSSSSTNSDLATIMVLNPVNGDIYLAGRTNSTNFPVSSNARQSSLGGTRSGFIQKYKSDGTQVWSSYFKSASSQSTSILCMEFNTLRNRLYFGGITSGLESPSNIPASGVYDNSHNGGTNDFFVACMDTSQTFVASTYIGGSGNEVNMMGLNVDLNNDVYVFGYSNSTNFPVTADALQSRLNNTSSNGSDPDNDKVFFKLPSDLKAGPLYSTYYGGSADDYDPVGERGIKFSNCRIYTIVTAKSNNIPLTQGAITTTKTSSTSIYEPGLVVWANPPDLLNNTITGNQTICAGAIPAGLTGSVPNYSLATILRNGSSSSYPATLPSATTYTWQSSTDSTNWTNIEGGNTQNLAPALMGSLQQKTYYRRIIGGDACVIAGAANQSVTVKVLSVSAEVSNITCFGLSDGKIKAVPDGAPPYSYTWKKDNVVISSSQTITGLGTGTYEISVTDASNCSASNTFSITQPAAPLSATATSTNATCGSSNGTATVVPAGGTAPYTYIWSNGGSSANITGVGAGFLQVTVKDANLCETSANTAVNNISNLSAGTASITPVDCKGNRSGSVTLSGSNGIAPYTYSFNGSTYGSSATFSGLVAGNYPASVKDDAGCISNIFVEIVEPAAPLSASLGGKSDAECAGQPGGSAQILVSGGTEPYSFTWSPTGGSGSSANALIPGAYTVQVKDARQCEAAPVAFNIGFADNTAPVWSSVAGSLNRMIECADEAGLSQAQTLVPVATDNCSVQYFKTSGAFVAGVCGAEGSYTNTWIAKDAAGNESAVFTQVITIRDQTAPSWTTAAGALDMTISCNDADALNRAQGRTPLASDLCGNVTIYKTPGAFVAGSCAGSGTYTNTWLAKDACNNTSGIFTQVITVVDNKAPEISACAPEKNIQTGADCKAQVPDFTQNISASDNCSTAGELIITQQPTAGTQVGPGNTSITITVKDACGNEATCNTALHVTGIIDATNDAGASVNGYAGGTSLSNVLVNDKLNCAVVNAADVTISQSSSSHPGVSLQGNAVMVAPGTPAGNYTLVYKICEIANPQNCDEAEVSVPVSAAGIEANDDAGSEVNGFNGGTSFSNVLVNDKLNGSAVNPAAITISFVSASAPEITLVGTDVHVAPGTPAGNYTLTYKICEILNPANCDEAVVTVPVAAPQIDAKDDAGIAVNGFTGGTSFSNVLVNDKLNGSIVNPADISLSFVSATHPGITLNGSDVEVAAGTPSGNYTLTYKICDNLNPANCDQAAVTVEVTKPAIDARDDDGGLVNGFSGGTSLVNVLANDLLNGVVVDPAKVSLSFVSSTNPGVTLSGKDAVVAPGTTSGNYTLTYKICEILNPANCDQAVVSVPVTAEPPVATKGEIAGCYKDQAEAEAAAIAATGVTPGNCAGNVNKTAVTSGTCEAEITVSVSDQCGNKGDVVYHTRIDNEAPIWSTQSGSLNRSVACNDAEALEAAQALSPQATDQCSGNITYNRTAGSFEAGNCGITGKYTNTWTATDACGNVSEIFTQVISIVDQSAPAWATAAGALSRSVSCDDAAGLEAAQGLVPEASDRCGGNIRISKTAGSFVSNGCGGSYTNTFTAMDACNNASEIFTQVISIFDQKAPEWSTSAHALDATVSCEDVSALAEAQSRAPEATDACSGVSYEKTSGTFAAASCGKAGTYTNEWIAKDACSNVSEKFVQVITIRDLLAPEITNCAIDSTVQAGAGCKALVPDLTLLVTATDNCDDSSTLKVTQVPVAGTETGPGSTEIQIRVEDACGNYNTCTAMLFVKSLIDAGNDAGNTVNGLSGGVSLDDVLLNDKLNCVEVNASEVNLTQQSSSHPGIILDGQSVTVAPGTPAGEYTLVYRICEKAHPSVCDEATVTVKVSAASITAHDDEGSIVNGYIGGTSLSNVLVNDRLNGNDVNEDDVNLSQVESTHPGISLSGKDVVVAPGTPAGNYSLVYRICEKLNPDNCDEATVRVKVSAPEILAVNDNGSAINGFIGGVSMSNVLTNDKLNGNAVNPSEINLSFISATHPGITLVGSDVHVAPGTPAGNYTLAYKICEILNPDNCDEAEVTVSVNATEIDAVNDAGSTVNGLTGGISFSNVLSNDKLNGAMLDPSDVNLSYVTASHPGISLNGVNVVVALGTPAGNYTLTYSICEKLNPANCDQAVVSVKVSEPVIDARDDEGGMVNGFAGGVSFSNVLANDLLNGAPFADDAVILTSVSSTHPGVTLNGKNVEVAAGTPTGNYTLTYKICELLNPSNCDQASVTVPVSAEAPVANKGQIAPCYASKAAAEAAAIAATTVVPGNCAGEIGKSASTSGACAAIVSVKITDQCGNIGTVNYQTRIDNLAPVWTSRQGSLNRNIPCNDPEALSAAQALSPEAEDNCAGVLTYERTAGSFAAGRCGSTGTYTNTWIAKDACGNTSAVFTQLISIIDETAPVWNTAADALNREVNCDDQAGLAAAQALEPLAFDACGGNLKLTKTSGSFVAGNCGGSYRNSWIAKDECGNVSVAYTQEIRIKDENAPEWTIAANALNTTAEVNDAQALQAAQQLAPEAADLCGAVTLEKTSGAFVAGNCGGTYTNTWVAKDKCGNASTLYEQLITVIDSKNPEWTSAAGSLDRRFECDETEALTAALALAPQASDNSGQATVELVHESTETFPGGAFYHKSWIAKDACGNTTEQFKQLVKVFDATTPVLSEAGPDKTIVCPEEPVFTPPTASDNCDPNPRVDILSTIRSAVNQNSGVYFVTRKWIAYDASGNSSGERKQTITVKPTETTLTKTICQGSSFQFYGNTYSPAGVYKVLIAGNNGCYELVKLILNVNQSSVAAQAINASSNTVISGSSVALSVIGGSLGTDAAWKWYKGSCGNGQAIGTGNSIVVSPTEPTTYFVRAEGLCNTTLCVSKTIEMERISSCSAHEIVSFKQGKRKDYGNVPVLRSNANNALGTPQYNDNANAPMNYVSLGFGGELILKFEYPIANGAGNDLRVVETSYGNPTCNAYREKVNVSVSQDGVSWKDLGEGCQNADFDLDAAGLPWAIFVKLKDASNRADFGAKDADGYDVDGIECLNGNAQISQCAAVRVIETRQGKTKAGQAVPSIRSKPEHAIGEPEPVVNNVVNFYSLGFKGEMTLEFDQPIANGDGPDVRVAEATWDGKVCSNYPESAHVFASQDGLFYTYLGKACHSESFDLGSLSWAKFIRILDDTDPASFPGDADGFDVNGVVCLNGTAINPQDDGLNGCSLQKVISYDPGKRKDGQPVNADRRNPEKALGLPENNQTFNFVSLGFGGTLVLGFDYVVFNRLGNDLKVVETSFGNRVCGTYPERAEISGSYDLVSWEILDTICLDGEVDLGKLPFAQFLKFRDLSDPSKFGGSDEGFDVDGVVALFDGCESIGSRIGKENPSETDLQAGHKEDVLVDIYPNPTNGNARISFNGLKRNARYNLALFDPAGRLLRKEMIEVNEGRNYFDLETASYPSGVLLVLINGDQERYVQRLVKK